MFVLHITSSGYYAWLKVETLWSRTEKFEYRGFRSLAEIIACKPVRICMQHVGRERVFLWRTKLGKLSTEFMF